MPSSLEGVVQHLYEAGHLDQADEIRRLLAVLEDCGWSGFITADEALKAMLDDTA